LLFRPIVTWAGKFKVELSESQEIGGSWVLNLLQRTYWIRIAAGPIFAAFRSLTMLPIRLPLPATSSTDEQQPSRLLDALWILIILAVAAWAAWLTIKYISTEVGWDEVGHVFVLTFYTLIRVTVLMGLASIIWVPISVWIGL